MQRLSRVLRLALVLAAILFAGPTVVFLRQSLAPENATYKDFGQEYLLARAFADGIDPYVPIRDLADRYLTSTGLLDKSFPTPHPPSVGLVFLPFVLVDYVTAVRIWFGIQVVSLLAGIALLLRQAGPPLRLRAAPVLAFAVLSWIPVGLDLGLGQLTSTLLLLLATAQLALCGGSTARTAVPSTRHDVLGGALLGVSLLLKPLAWPWLLPLVFRRRWASVGTTVLVAVGGFTLPSLRLGLSPLTEYLFDVLPSVSAQYATETTNISFWTIGPRLFRGIQSGPLAGMPPVVAWPRTELVAAVVPLAVLLLCLAWLRTRPPLATALGVMTCVSIVINPISWAYYLVLLLVPAAQLIVALHRQGYPRIPTLLAALLAVGLYFDGGSWYHVALSVNPQSQTPGHPPATIAAAIAAVLSMGPALAAAGIGLLLAYASRPPARGCKRRPVAAAADPVAAGDRLRAVSARR